MVVPTHFYLDYTSALRWLKIWENPELGYEEVHAHEVLTDYLEEQGFTVTRGAYNLSTAFRAEFSNGEGRKVSFNSEYDALPGVGHACGHNLIATVGVAAAIGVKEALENGGVKGSVVLLGTPAEEGGGGKVKLIDAGAYDGLDCSLMAHPGNSGPRRDAVLNQVVSIIEASALATNTSVEIVQFQDYWDQHPSFQLAQSFYEHQMEHFDPSEDPKTANFTISTPEDSRRNPTAAASSDQATLQVGFPVGGTAPVHNAGFRELAGTDFAHQQAIETAKILALTGLEILRNETYAKTMWAEWRTMIDEAAGSIL
ncbi:hypothetical protein ACHAQA_003702 [Verticillium albo-atrum]